MSDIVLLGKLALSLAGAFGILVLLRYRPFERLTAGAFTRSAVASLALARLSLFGLVLVALRVPAQSDVLTYHDLAEHVLAGEVPHRDFFNGYAPLFPYLAAIPVWVWHSPKSIVLLGVLLELIAFPLWLDVARRCFGEPAARTTSVLYVMNPFLVWNIPLVGQNNVWLSLSLASSLYLLCRERDFASGLAFGAGVVLVKFLSLLHAPVLFIGALRRFRFGAGLAALPVVVYGTMWSQRISAVASLRYHSVDASSGNIPYLLTLFGLDLRDPGLNRLYNIVGVAVIAAVFLIPLARHRGFNRQQVIHMITLLLFTLVLVSRKSFSGYLVIGLFAICLTVTAGGLSRRRLCTLLGFGVVVTLESSLWFRWLNHGSLQVVWQSTLPDGLTRPGVLAFFAVELALLAFYVHYFREAWLRVREAGDGAGALPARGTG